MGTILLLILPLEGVDVLLLLESKNLTRPRDVETELLLLTVLLVVVRVVVADIGLEGP